MNSSANRWMTGVGGREGAFVMVTFWLVEAMMRVSTPSLAAYGSG